MEEQQVSWRAKHVASDEHGNQNGKTRPWILPEELWEEGLLPSVRTGTVNALTAYLSANGVQKHDGVHNLKSSWMLCANLYYPFGQDRAMLAGFLRSCVDERIESVKAVELEYAEGPPLDPATLLGEPGGTRGANQTSPDVAFLVTLTDGSCGVVLTENKWTEHGFYECAGHKRKNGNPAPGRCMDPAGLLADTASRCWLCNWERGRRANRRYWDHVQVSDTGKAKLTRCPAATAGYQLFRQQSLAEGMAVSGNYGLVASCVAYDERNETLIHCLRSTGVDDFRTDWAAMWNGRVSFATFSHQQWYAYVREHDTGQWTDWLAWIGERYGL